MRLLFARILLLIASLAAAGGAGETMIRIAGDFDAAGNFTFRNRLIRPLRLPVERVDEAVRRLQESDASSLIYDEVLGWKPRPGGRSADGLYAYNSQGIRSPVPAFAARPDSGVLRIAIFGDSFTHGDDVPYADSWGALLEAELNEGGLPAEVLNFGVGGYGIDQAMLRYTTEGKGYAPQVVVLGFQPEDMKRNLNLLRPLFDPRTRLPLAKPRFVVTGDGISVINVPVLPPERVAPTLRNLDAWDLLPYEHFYDPADYRGPWWRGSKLLAVLADLRRPEDDPWLLKRVIYRDRSEEQQLSWAVIAAFAREVREAGGVFVVVHLPTPPDMDVRRGLGRWPYQTFLDELDRTYVVAHPEDRLIALAAREGIAAVFRGHLTRAGNAIVAAELARTVAAALGPAAADPSRP